MHVIQYHPNRAGSGQHGELAWEVCQGNHGGLGCARKFYDAKQFLGGQPVYINIIGHWSVRPSTLTEAIWVAVQ